MTAPKLTIDMNIAEWPLRDQMAYRKQVGVNPQFAFVQVAKAFEGSEGGVVSDAALNIPPEYLLGMAWVTMRRKNPDLEFDAVIDIAGTSDGLYEAFADAINVAAEEPEERPTKAARAKASTARTTA